MDESRATDQLQDRCLPLTVGFWRNFSPHPSLIPDGKKNAEGNWAGQRQRLWLMSWIWRWRGQAGKQGQSEDSPWGRCRHRRGFWPPDSDRQVRNPVPGDEIVGYITRVLGGCPSGGLYEPQEPRKCGGPPHWVDWEEDNSNKEYMANIDIYGPQSLRLLNDVLKVLTNSSKIFPRSMPSQPRIRKFATIHVSFGIPNLSSLTSVVDKNQVCSGSLFRQSGPMDRRADMRIVIQRVSQASVSIDGKIAGEIQQGLLLLVEFLSRRMGRKISSGGQKNQPMRIFSDQRGQDEFVGQDVGRQILSISVYPLCGYQKGNRPAFTGSPSLICHRPLRPIQPNWLKQSPSRRANLEQIWRSPGQWRTSDHCLGY